MPIYPFRCRDCRQVTELFARLADKPDAIVCEQCGSDDTFQVIGRVAYHADAATKTARLDPKYDKMVDASMRKSANADEHRLLNKMTPFSAGSDN